MKFGEAIEKLKSGKKLSRTGWNGKGMFIFMQIPSEIKKEIVPKMQSLPQSVKDEFEKSFNDSNSQIDAIYYTNQVAIVGLSNTIQGWSPTIADCFAEDWFVLP